MNDWPPPRSEQVVPASPSAATPWLRRPVVRALLVIWVLTGVVAMVVIAAASSTDDSEVSASIPNATTRATGGTDAADITNTVTTDITAPTTAPQVRSAPPVPPLVTDTVPPVTGRADATTPTTITVTLPSTMVPAGAPPLGARSIEITTRFDADGDDGTNLNGEWVRFTNTGAAPVDLTGWVVRDDGQIHAHVFETLTLAPGAAVMLYSGCGTPTTSERFFCTTSAEIWNNDGDVVSLFDDRGELVVQARG